MAKRLIRLCKNLALTGAVYRPKALLEPDTPREELVAYYQKLWDKLLDKWKRKGNPKDAFAPEHPLGRWRDMARELYGLELRLSAKSSPAKT